jgi:hypothetical protein
MKKQFLIFVLVIFFGLLLSDIALATYAENFEIVGPIESTTLKDQLGFTYVSPNGQLWLVPINSSSQSSKRTYDPVTKKWGPEPPEPEDIGLPSSPASVHGYLSPDQQTIFYVQGNTGNEIQRGMWSNGMAVGPFEDVPYTPVSYDIVPCFSNNQLFFTADIGAYDIYYADYDIVGDTFGPSIPLSAINTSAAEHSPRVSSDGSLLIFASNRSGGEGGWDLYYSAWNGSAWSIAENMNQLCPGINTSEDEMRGMIAEDAGFLFFSRGSEFYEKHEFYQVQVVPEPGTFLLLGLGGLILRRRKGK